MRFRPATREDSRQLAEFIYLADLAHYDSSGYEFSIGGTRRHLLEELAKLAAAPGASQFHYSHFDVAEVPDGTLAAAVASFDKVTAGEHAIAALEQVGWTPAQIQALATRLAPLSGIFPEEVPLTWTIEHVATLPPFRGQGLIRTLLERALERGAQLGFRQAAVDVFKGNDRALGIYQAAGFRPVTTFGDEPLRALFNRDPLMRLVRPLTDLTSPHGSR